MSIVRAHEAPFFPLLKVEVFVVEGFGRVFGGLERSLTAVALVVERIHTRRTAAAHPLNSIQVEREVGVALHVPEGTLTIDPDGVTLRDVVPDPTPALLEALTLIHEQRAAVEARRMDLEMKKAKKGAANAGRNR